MPDTPFRHRRRAHHREWSWSGDECDSYDLRYCIAEEKGVNYGGMACLAPFSVSLPSAPVQVGYLFPSSRAHKVVVSGDYAYVAGWSAGLRVIDVSVPSAPGLVGFYDTPGHAFDVAVVGEHAFIADHFEGL